MLDQYIEITKGKKLKTIESSQFYHLPQKFMKTLDNIHFVGAVLTGSLMIDLWQNCMLMALMKTALCFSTLI